MIKKVYLLWNSYTTNELLVVASLTKIDSKYCFKYESDALKAMKCGCMLPFMYTHEPIYFNALPGFFAQRMLKKDMINKLGIHYDPNDELSILTCNYGRRNNDNFSIIREEMLENLKEKVNIR